MTKITIYTTLIIIKKTILVLWMTSQTIFWWLWYSSQEVMTNSVWDRECTQGVYFPQMWFIPYAKWYYQDLNTGPLD